MLKRSSSRCSLLVPLGCQWGVGWHPSEDSVYPGPSHLVSQHVGASFSPSSNISNALPPDCDPEVTTAMLRWIYTDELELREDDLFLTELMKLANRFQLQLLRERQASE